MKVISLALFDAQDKNCHSFSSFLRMFAITIRAYKYIFPEWEIILHIDEEVKGRYIDYFSLLEKDIQVIKIRTYKKAPLTRAMLWRIDPVDYAEVTLCRDIDSLPTLRERQAVEYWLTTAKKAHGIVDSISHNIPMMGGMCGFLNKAFTVYPDRYNMSWKTKGMDQAFLMAHVYPKVADSFLLHSFLGLPGGTTELVKDTWGIDPACNDLVNHIGQGGFHLDKTYNPEINKTYAGALNYYVKTPPPEIAILNDQLLSVEADLERKHNGTFYWT